MDTLSREVTLSKLNLSPSERGQLWNENNVFPRGQFCPLRVDLFPEGDLCARFMCRVANRKSHKLTPMYKMAETLPRSVTAERISWPGPTLVANHLSVFITHKTNGFVQISDHLQACQVSRDSRVTHANTSFHTLTRRWTKITRESEN